MGTPTFRDLPLAELAEVIRRELAGENVKGSDARAMRAIMGMVMSRMPDNLILPGDQAADILQGLALMLGGETGWCPACRQPVEWHLRPKASNG